MDRRRFLVGLGGALAASFPVNAQSELNAASPTMVMPPSGSNRQRNIPTLPEGAPLRELPRLSNSSDRAGYSYFNLTAQPATAHIAESFDTPILAYNGLSPGPLFEATEGDHVWINFKNLIPDEPTTVHWHGMSVPADMDGNPTDRSPEVSTASMHSISLMEAPDHIGIIRIRMA